MQAGRSVPAAAAGEPAAATAIRAADSSPAPTGPDIYELSTATLSPTQRPLKVYAFDPSAGHFLGNDMRIAVRYEPLEPGPIGERFAVIDYDGGNRTYYTPVDLDAPNILIQGGIDPTESDPRFHQQMVYAVASETLQRFESALGRRVKWSHADRVAEGRDGAPAGGINRLAIFPHAMPQANAFYSPEARGILFGYFRASRTQPGRNLPGQTIFTCLSHDIIAHETTHAIVGSVRSYFTEPTNIDVLAFHEAFADLAALFRHFSHKEALLDTLQKTGGQLFRFQLEPEAGGKEPDPVIQAQTMPANPLIQLAQQFGEASGMRAGLRSALSTRPGSDDIKHKTEPHDRGAILVAAVFDAYFTIYTRRTANLFRIYRAGGGAAHPLDLPGPLAELLAAEASRTAERFFTLCARALDYCPPVDITFGDFLRALITADMDLSSVDPEGVRDALMQAFRLRGIVADSARFFSEDALCWERVRDGGLPAVAGLVFGDPNGLTKDEKDANGKALRAYANTRENAALLGFDLANGPIAAPSFHPMFRIAQDGVLKTDMVVELVQTLRRPFDPDRPELGMFPMRGGVTLMIPQPILKGRVRPDPQIRYVICKHISQAREQRQRAFYAGNGHVQCQHAAYPARQEDAGSSDDPRFRINFGLLHEGL